MIKKSACHEAVPLPVNDHLAERRENDMQTGVSSSLKS